MRVALISVLIFAVAAQARKNFYEYVPRHINPPVSDFIRRVLGSKIVGGEEATPNEFPFQAGLFINTASGRFFCGGTLVSENYVLTAAHCIENATSIEVVLGAHNIREDEQYTYVTNKYKIHEEWDSSNLVNDIALIELLTPADLNDKIQIVDLPTYNDVSNSFAGEEGTAIGWGVTSDSATTISEVLHYVQSEIITNLLCNLSYLGIIQSSHVCLSGSGGKSTCSGDSGGPLMADGIQVGITSFGISLGCEVGWPAVFTRVSSYLSWIEENSDVVIDWGTTPAVTEPYDE